MTTYAPSRRDRDLAPLGGIALSCVLLLVVMLLALAGVGSWAFAVHGQPGLLAAVVAGLLCSVAALAALLISASFANTPHALAANLGTMLVRMGAPLIGLMALPNLLPGLAQAGLGNSILVLYLVGLVAETMLSLRHVAVKPGGVAAARPVSSGQPLEAK